MIQIYNNLYVGNQDDYELNIINQDGWAVVHACKEPYHRQALGYSGRGAPKEHPEYLIAQRGNRLILNLVDVDNYKFVANEIIDRALSFIDDSLNSGLSVLVHCNQGFSRGPSIGLLYLATKGIIENISIESAVNEFKNIYPMYEPAKGIYDFMKNNCEIYCGK